MNDQENLIKNGFDIWRQFGQTYSKSLTTMMEKNLEQSKNYQGQMQKVVSQMITNQYDLAAESIKNLESQGSEFVNSWDEILKEDSA